MGVLSIYLVASILLLAGVSCQQQQNGRIIVCYFVNWAQYRKDVGKFLPQNIDPSLCTHIYYAFTKVDPAGNTIKPIEWNDADALYPAVLALKQLKPKLKIILSIGGYNEIEQSWVAVSSTAETAEAFSRNVIAYLRLYGFDGLDLDWEFPRDQTYSGFQTLVQAMRRELDKEILQPGKERLLLSIDVLANRNNIQYYNPKVLAQAMDLVLVMAYDFYGSWEPILGHHSPLFLSNSDRMDPARNFLSESQAIDMWENAGIPKQKLVLGFAAYGRSLLMSSPNLNKPGDSYTKQYPAAAPFTKAPGTYAYYEVCGKGQAGWTEVFMQESRVPYVYGIDPRNNELVWVGYDNQQSFTEKAMFVVQRGIAGAMIWDLSFDDFTGTQCGQGKYPLLKAINNIFEKAKCAVDSDCEDVLTGGVCIQGDCTCQYGITVTADNRYLCTAEKTTVPSSEGDERTGASSQASRTSCSPSLFVQVLVATCSLFFLCSHKRN